jgi:hypothetical protein
MNYVGIDIHKRYSVFAAQDEQGRKLGVARIEGHLGSGFAQYLRGLGGESKVVIEACWGWGKIHDVLEELPEVSAIARPPNRPLYSPPPPRWWPMRSRRG